MNKPFYKRADISQITPIRPGVYLERGEEPETVLCNGCRRAATKAYDPSGNPITSCCGYLLPMRGQRGRY